MDKPLNPYRKGSLAWSLMEGDWKHKTKEQIAEKLNCSVECVTTRMHEIKIKTGYVVPYAGMRKKKVK